MTTTPEPKAIEPSDEELRAIAARTFLCTEYAPLASAYVEGHHSGRASRDAEIADLQDALRDRRLRVRELEENVDIRCGQVEALKAERDKLHAALAWRETNAPRVIANGVNWRVFDGSRLTACELHDSTPAGRAAALVRLWERVTREGAGT